MNTIRDGENYHVDPEVFYKDWTKNDPRANKLVDVMSNKNTKVLQLVALRKVVDSIAKKIYGSDYKNYLSDP